jgi:glycosyltransferase involved in cell wall biosynthesis
VQISRYHDVWALTSTEHQAAVEAEIAVNPLPGVKWLYVQVPGWKMPNRERGRRIHYYLWQIMAYRAAKRLQHRVRFDVIHHLTYASYWTPSFLAQLDVPFVWGPVGGGESIPPQMYATLTPEARRFERVRDLARQLSHNLDPFVKRTARRAAASLATTGETAVKMRELGASTVLIAPESGLPETEIQMLNALPELTNDGPFRVISMGRLVGWKGFHLGIMSFAELVKQHPDSEYWIVGDGVERPRLESLARELEVDEKVKFFGLLPRAEALRCLAQSHVLLHPSLHDSGGWVCLEAMAAGRPVVCLNLGGPAVQVTDSTGIRVIANTPEQTVRDLVVALDALASSSQKRLYMGKAGKQRVWDEFNWNDKGARVSQVYRNLVRG